MSSFGYSCFISYCHGQYDLMRNFVEQLRSALQSSLEPYFDLDIFLDTDRLKPGYRFSQAIAKAVCRSVCMIVVYVPKYQDHPYCLREFQAMEEVERRRFKLTGNDARDRGLIIPLVLRGDVAHLPPRIRDHLQVADFSAFTTAATEIGKSREFLLKIDNIAKYIHDRHQEFKQSGADLCGECASFRLPSAAPADAWNPIPGLPFPGRGRS